MFWDPDGRQQQSFEQYARMHIGNGPNNPYHDVHKPVLATAASVVTMAFLPARVIAAIGLAVLIQAENDKDPKFGTGIFMTIPGMRQLVGGVSNPPGLFSNRFPEHEIGPPRVASLKQMQEAYRSQRLNYVVTEDNSLVVGYRFPEVGGGHIDLAQGRPVRAAGEVLFVKGEIKMLNNKSGHYLPRGPAAQHAAEQAFGRAGFDVSGKYKNVPGSQ